MGNADGPNFGERGFDDLAEAMEYAESPAAGSSPRGATRSPWDRVPKRPHRSAAKPLPSSTPQHARSEPWSRRTTSSSRATSARRKR